MGREGGGAKEKAAGVAAGDGPAVEQGVADGGPAVPAAVGPGRVPGRGQFGEDGPADGWSGGGQRSISPVKTVWAGPVMVTSTGLPASVLKSTARVSPPATRTRTGGGRS